jgi:hypothetical protein
MHKPAEILSIILIALGLVKCGNGLVEMGWGMI